MTRQRRWQLRRLAAGLCTICGKAEIVQNQRCAFHQQDEGWLVHKNAMARVKRATERIAEMGS